MPLRLDRIPRLPALLKSYLRDRLLRMKVSAHWDDEEGGARLRRRRYRSYEAYVAHQRSKLERVQLGAYDVEYRQVLAARLAAIADVRPGASVLCLAARLGTEVKAFADRGCFAVGIDLNPGQGNRHVVHGDFHDLQFADGSVAIVFTNSLDHCFDLQRVLAEVRRVLAPGGLFIVEAIRGEDEGGRPLFYESFSWATLDELARAIEGAGFEAAARASFEYPWPGEQLCFRPRPGRGTGARPPA
jgi:SAM-dependent methyltransferase